MARGKKSKRNIIIIIVIVLLFLSAIGNCSGGNKSSSSSSSNSAASTAASSESSSDSESSESSLDTAPQPEKATIELVAGEAGEYGRELIMSAGTDLEEKLVVYYVPAGTYSVENLGRYRTQVNVYESEGIKHGENGYDEYTGGSNILVLDAGKTGDITVPEGWFIEIHEPDHIALTAK